MDEEEQEQEQVIKHRTTLDKFGTAIYRLESLLGVLKSTGNMAMVDFILEHAYRMQHLHQELIEEIEDEENGR